MEDKSPIWARYAPLLAGCGYFVFGRYVLKQNLGKTIFWAMMVGFSASIPWFIYNKKGKMPAILSSGVGTSLSSVTEKSNLDTMNKAGRQEAISYIMGQMQKIKSGVAGDHPQQNDTAAYQTLTNDELKALYLVYKFIENKEQLAKYGVTDDALAKKIAKENFGINADGIKNLKDTSTLAIVKIGNYYLNNPAS